jgi:hypothetical protein
MGRSSPPGQHFNLQLCGRLLQQLGQQVRGTCCTDLGQRTAVLLGSLGGAVLHPRHLSSTHHSIPPSGERVSGEVSQAAKGGPESEAGQPRLALPPPLGHAGAAPKEDCGLSSAEMVYGEALALPGEFLEASTRPGDNFLQLLPDRMSQFQPPPTRPVKVKPASQQEAALHKADFVYVKRGAVASSLSPLYSGPYRVISRGEKTFHVDIGGRNEVISADRLKPHLGQAPVQPASPPKRGRPPAPPQRWGRRPRTASRVAVTGGPRWGG